MVEKQSVNEPHISLQMSWLGSIVGQTNFHKRRQRFFFASLFISVEAGDFNARPKISRYKLGGQLFFLAKISAL